MVGSINAYVALLLPLDLLLIEYSPARGNTLNKFKWLAERTHKPSIAPPTAPLVGTLKANGKTLRQKDLHGNVFDPTKGNGNNGYDGGSKNYNGHAPPPGKEMDPYMKQMAGGSQPTNYKYGPSLSEEAFELLQLLQYVDNALLEVLWAGHKNLTTGRWRNAYPSSIIDTLGSMAAQATVHRHTSTDAFKHYNKPMVEPCKYRFPTSTADDFVDVTTILALLDTGVLLDIQAETAQSDPWLVPALGTNLGSKAKMTAVLNMMQAHVASSTPREVMLPPDLVYSYVSSKYVEPGSCPTKLKWADQYEELIIIHQERDSSKRMISITIKDVTIENPYIAWIGSWGGVEYSKVDRDGKAEVPKNLYGHVWCVLVQGQGEQLRDLERIAKRGPEIVFVTSP